MQTKLTNKKIKSRWGCWDCKNELIHVSIDNHPFKGYTFKCKKHGDNIVKCSICNTNIMDTWSAHCNIVGFALDLNNKPVCVKCWQNGGIFDKRNRLICINMDGKIYY